MMADIALKAMLSPVFNKMYAFGRPSIAPGEAAATALPSLQVLCHYPAVSGC